MKWFLNLPTRTKLFIAFGLMIVSLVIVIAIAYSGFSQSRDAIQTLYEKDFAVVENLLELRSDQNRTRSLILEMMFETKRSEQEKLIGQINEGKGEIDSSLVHISKLSADDAEFISKIEKLKSLLADYRKTRSEEFALILQNRPEDARQLGASVQTERYEQIRSIAVDLSEKSKQHAQTAIMQSEQTINSAISVFIFIGSAAILLGIVMTIFLNRIIANPLKEITDTAGKIASGELNINVMANHRYDEVGILSQTFGRMVLSLQGIASTAQQIAEGNLTVYVKPQSEKDLLGNAFARMIENLRKITKEILEGVNVLASSAGEILAATTQVASGATETATSVSETTTTVEEVKQTAQVATQKAKYVSESSQKAVQVSQTGKKSVEETINMMNKIREQMESVAESIVKLSEQSQSIGEIISTVNDLADQSNLLAVNASIEAAKAGEQGKGFAVVAQEVKSLAELSKQATAQVRTILSDVQKAMSAAVLATEQGTKSVEAGVKQTAEAGESIRVLAESITEATQAATQIAASSQQQSVGMDQVAQAMENIKQASAQNVSGTRQAESAAKNLHDLGSKLKMLVEQYKL